MILNFLIITFRIILVTCQETFHMLKNKHSGAKWWHMDSHWQDKDIYSIKVLSLIPPPML